jgi:cytochrome c peroxidase
MRTSRFWRAVVLSSTAVACGKGSDPFSGFTAAEVQQIKSLSPLPTVPADPTNRYADNPAAVALGQRFFFEKAYSGPLGTSGVSGGLGSLGQVGRVSCASCHMSQSWFIDTRSNPPNVSSGANGFQSRNTPSLVNNMFYTWFNHNGGRDTQWIAGTSVEGASSTNGTRLTLAHRVFNAYRAEYDATFTPRLDPALDPNAPDAARFPPSGKPKARPSDPDGPWEMMTPADQLVVNTILANFGKATEAYERLLVSRNAPFDHFVAGDAAAITDGAKRGAKLFVGKAGCIACHLGPAFTDNRFHNLGVPQVGPNVPSTDEGRFAAIPGLSTNPFSGAGRFSDDPVAGQGKLSGLTQNPADTGSFRTADLRNIAQTAPYMHTGAFATLADVVEFYDRGGGSGGFVGTKDSLMVPLGLASSEKSDLVAFLEALTGDTIPDRLVRDTSAP